MVTIRTNGLLVLLLIGCTQHRAAGQTIEDLLGDGRSRWVQFQVVDGRIQSKSPYFGRYRRYSGDDNSHWLTVGTNSAGVGVIRYSGSDTKRSVAVEATESGALTITRSPKADDGPVYQSYTQPDRGPVVLSIGPVQKRRRLEADSIWHLLLQHPQECQEHLYPLLEVIHNGWHWDRNVEKLTSELFRLAEARNQPDRAKWVPLVEQLASDTFAQRRRAERLLRGFGRAVAPYLQSLDRKKLDAEQQFRIRRIVQASYGTSGDTPARIATWLVGDPLAWVPLLASDDAERRRLALDQLKELVDTPLTFDPNADVTTRQKQLDKIRQTLAR